MHSADLWALKPWWCQPWSIVLTGLALPVASWVVLGRWWITAPVAMAVLAWWWLFLVLAPRIHREQSADRVVSAPES